MTTVCGIDHSISRTGLAVLRSSHEPQLITIASEGKDTDTRPMRGRRMRDMRTAIMDQVPRDTRLTVMEGFAFSKNLPGQDRIHHLWWLLADAHDALRIPLVVIPPNTLKKAITDNGRAEKPEVLAVLRQMWPGVRIPNHDVGDALAAGTTAAIHERMPVPFLVLERHRLAIAKLDWPLPA